MRAPGPVLASGRDAQIFEYGPGLVLRRSRDGRSLAKEAEVMAYLRDQGYPVPAVEDISEDGSAFSMERIDGPTMVEAVGRAPWSIRRQGRVLADLHRRLHELTAPPFLPLAPVGQGKQLVHLDLHPLNVIIGPRGPVVIDWTNASCGDPAVDVGLAWVLLSVGEIPGSRVRARLLGWGRRLLVDSFMASFDRAEVVSQLRSVVEWKVMDPHMTPAEIAKMWRLVEAAAWGG